MVTPEVKIAKAKQKMARAVDAMLNKLGGNYIPHGLLFQIMNERAQLKGFKLDAPCDVTDICFVGTGEAVLRDHIMNGRSTSTRAERRRAKRKYESPEMVQPPAGDEAQQAESA